MKCFFYASSLWALVKNVYRASLRGNPHAPVQAICAVARMQIGFWAMPWWRAIEKAIKKSASSALL
jgi:hypothetical protein